MLGTDGQQVQWATIPLFSQIIVPKGPQKNSGRWLGYWATALRIFRHILKHFVEGINIIIIIGVYIHLYGPQHEVKIVYLLDILVDSGNNITIPDIFGSNWPFLTGSPKEKNKQIHCSSVQSSDQKFLFAELLKLFHLMDLYLTCLIMVCWIPTHYKGPISGNTLKNHILQNVRCWVLIISWN